MRPTEERSAIGQWLVEALAGRDDPVAFVDGRTFSYAEVRAEISRAGQWLGARGIGPGDTVAQLSGSSARMFFLMAACYIGGLRSVTLHPMGGAPDQAQIIAESQARLCVYDEPHRARIAELRACCPTVEDWVSHDAGGDGPSLWDAAARFEPQELVAHADPDAIVRLAYTGGTTGGPKGVMLSAGALGTNVELALRHLDWPDHPKLLCATPISHGAGSWITPVLCRGGTVLLHRVFDAGAVLDTVASGEANMLWTVPTMLGDLVSYRRDRDLDLAGLHTVIYTGAPAGAAVVRQALDAFGPILVQCYGLTEAPNLVLMLGRAEHRVGGDRLGAAGRPLPGIDVELRADDGDRVVTPGKVGEICVRGPLVMSGYWKRPDLTSEVLNDGWLHTGDMAWSDPDGYLHIVDRRRDIVITGGFNVYSQEVESVVAEHPAVAAVAVIGLPHPRWGEVVAAVVVPHPHRAVTEADIIDFVRARKGPIQAPKTVTFVDRLALTALGKPDKPALRAMMLAAAANRG